MKKCILISVTIFFMISCKKEDNMKQLPNRIGTQIWSISNLDVSTYRNGDSIPQVADPAQWAALTTGAWCYYKNEPTYNTTYGKLYNWYAVNDSRGLAPSGWHIPSDAEWTILTDYLGGNAIAGGKMKAKSSLWHSPNIGVTNNSIFLGLPGGNRDIIGTFYYAGDVGSWWSASEENTTSARSLNLDWSSSHAFRYESSKKFGYSVRCIKD